MKKSIICFLFLIACIGVLAQEIQEEAVAINVEVPVRVYRGKTFVDNLTIHDFELYENGILQNLDAVYLVKKTDIERREENKRFNPSTQRHFFLNFQISEYTTKIDSALEYFFDNVMTPTDELTIVSPMKTYKLHQQVLRQRPKEEIVAELRGKLRKDTQTGNSEYRATVRELSQLARVLGGMIQGGVGVASLDPSNSVNPDEVTGSIEEIINQYRASMEKLETLRRVNEQNLLDFSNYLQDVDGQKHLFLFYQREFIPIIDPKVLNQAGSMFQDTPTLLMDLSSINDFYRRDITFNVERVKRAYSDSEISIHFLFFTQPAQSFSGLRMEEHSEDIFSAFSEMALASGGTVESSANPDYLFKYASEATENYYMIYYTPKNFVNDGKFKSLEVRVKTPGYRITHRAGYFAK
ncbi:hypothetical protein ACFLT9_11575 [Acidobacteriota bacterium]